MPPLVCLASPISLPPLRQTPFPLLLSTARQPIPFGNPNLSYRPSLPVLFSFPGARRGQRNCRRTIPCCSSMPNSSTDQRVLSQAFLSNEKAFWVLKSLIAWNTSSDVASVCLYASWDAKLCLTDRGLEGEDFKIPLEWERCGLPSKVLEKFPHIRDYKAYTVPASVDFRKILKCQLAIASFGDDGKCSDVTGIQLPGVLDDLFAYDGPLGAIFSKRSITLNLWAPTAQVVHALLYKCPSAGDPFECIHLKDQDGVWCAVGPRSWEGCYYVYQISVYHQSTVRVETYTVSDPYARGISSNGSRTLLVDLNSEDLKPSGWDDLAYEKPDLPSFSDISIYELHIRDFSENDQSVDPDFRGGYLAFTCQDSLGINHLKKLSNAGLTHLHLLPCFQFAGVDDDKSQWKHTDDVMMSKLPADSEQQQAIITSIQDEDGYNWGYNPVLWGVPKGSYASNPNGPCRILEFRKMIQALNHIGLRVVLDVVYNHVHASGPLDETSILDKVVPGYYLRRTIEGCIEHSTCMNNTASEHFMVERLIIDDLLNWATAYKVDGFRFDLMGHLMKGTMLRAKAAIENLTKDVDGVEGSKIYLYGEGWDFGEVAKNKRGINASQLNITGNGIGSFNDRLRDAILGGSPFGHPLQQGFVTGLLLQPNEYDHGDKHIVDGMLSTSADHIQVGLAANLRNFVLTSHKGDVMKGCEILTHDGMPVGYALSPTETVNYVSAHDNETLFDIICLKAPVGISVDDRCRINHVATSIVALSQGIPFFHCGDDMLRSKSLDRDSYNSGDWFNRLDFSYQSNNWGVGLPPREKNENNWPLIRPRLADSSFKPQKHHILAAVENFIELLQIRYSSQLFRLQTANDIQERVRFLNTGTSWVQGVIVMSIEDCNVQLDHNYSYIVIIFNACPTEVSVPIPALKRRALQLHPVLLDSADSLVKRSSYESSSGCFKIPQRTTAVFVEECQSDRLYSSTRTV
ncbi:hypothetical protein KFK09_009998 [Dendrobium nobile]|uniref:Pullulanase 1, chloroplastic n=1 Tax=Dendrobium nobile TaxID=94219 RepID=A0A8T3BP56_DENNO|nr:hypothetical protein KFK09_009998 [Dendrobium nobile]